MTNSNSKSTLYATFLALPLAISPLQAALVADYDFQQYSAGAYGEDGAAGAGNTVPRVFDPSTTLTFPTGITSISDLTITVVGGDLNVTDNNNGSIRFRQRSIGAGNPVSYSFSVTVASGYQMNDFSLSFIQNGNTGANSPIAFFYDPNGTGSVAMGTDTMNANDTPTLSTSTTVASAFTGTIDFLITMDPQVANRNFRVDDFQLNGTVALIPEPSAALLNSLGVLALLRRRRA